MTKQLNASLATVYKKGLFSVTLTTRTSQKCSGFVAVLEQCCVNLYDTGCLLVNTIVLPLLILMNFIKCIPFYIIVLALELLTWRLGEGRDHVRWYEILK